MQDIALSVSCPYLNLGDAWNLPIGKAGIKPQECFRYTSDDFIVLCGTRSIHARFIVCLLFVGGDLETAFRDGV